MDNTQANDKFITFKPTTSTYKEYKHPYDPTQTVQHLKEVIGAHYEV